MAKLKLMDCFTLLIMCLYLLTVNVSAGNQTLKKDLHDDKIPVDEVIKLPENELHHVVPDKNAKEEPAAAHEQITTIKNDQQSFAVEKQQKLSPVPQEPTISPKERFSHVVEETKYKTKDANLDYEDDDLPGSYITGFYIFIGLSMCAMLFIVVRVYRLRLSRAERRYGVQGDRSTHELVPLPVSIEDDNSEDEDHTLFEVNRQQIRIL
ncbi:uncharacterized protein LOC126756841 [Bactrocera neohumeralis]|uniref:uncharacterized protein LOC120773089 n=1 Tax=Bactrocera tryoni TaxID=59916 RepID=UPI001A967AD7|nr:uncharacterized protein LOC120773089 [Bactrocera tryoni]XP_050326214.1 uncharacterized protein LOC126756841 [Bactrocera neohumeralis]XP_050326215.1 uncharacterized protein LOC126756841 [Bactrocera neohumeralis]